MAKARPKNTRNVATIQTPAGEAMVGAGPDDLPCKWDVVDGVCFCFVCGAGPDDARRLRRTKRLQQAM
jgi:hypothetical protein